MSTQILPKVPSLQQRRCWARRRPEEHQARSLRSLREYAFARPPIYGWFSKGVAERPLNVLSIPSKEIQAAEGLTMLPSGIHEGFADAALSPRREFKVQGTIVSRVEVRRVLAIPRTTAGKGSLIKSDATHHAEKEH